MDPALFAPSCREPGQWGEDLLISTITLSNRVFLDSPRLRRLRSVGHMALLLWGRRQKWAKLTESQDAEAVSVVGTVSLVHVTWEDGQPLLTPEMEVWPEPHQWARLTIMTRSSHFVSLNTVNLRGFQQILLPLGSSNCDSVYTMKDAFPKLMINLINLNSSQKRNHMFPPRMSGSVQVAN